MSPAAIGVQRRVRGTLRNGRRASADSVVALSNPTNALTATTIIRPIEPTSTCGANTFDQSAEWCVIPSHTIRPTRMTTATTSIASVAVADTLIPRTISTVIATAATTMITQTIGSHTDVDTPILTAMWLRYKPTARSPAMLTEPYPTIADHAVGSATRGPNP